MDKAEKRNEADKILCRNDLTGDQKIQINSLKSLHFQNIYHNPS